MRILISGGGIAGLTAAYWLNQIGMTPVVIERGKEVRRDGYGIDFFGTGYDVAERMGIIDRLQARQLGAAYIGFVDNSGNDIAKLDIETMRKAVGGKYMPLMHDTLERALYDAVRGKVEVRFGTSIRSITQTADSVEVLFEGGGQESFDLLVGADGIHSNVRDLVFGPEREFAHYMGYYVASYTLPIRYDVDNGWNTYGEPGRQFGVYRNDRPNEIVPLFIWKAQDEGMIPRSERLKKLREVYAGMGWIVPQVLTDTPTSTDIYMDRVTQIRMEGWSRQRVVLIGDACACPTLVSGQGASLAMGGAYLLAEELGRSRDYREAFAYYEDRMRPQTDLRQKKAQDLAKSYVPNSELGLVFQHTMMKVLLSELFAGVLANQLMGESILRSEALHRLTESHSSAVGYRVEGKLRTTDYETLRLDVQFILAKHHQICLLLQLEPIEGIEPGAVLDDFELGLDFRKAIDRLAIVGDSHLASWGAIFAQRFYARTVRHFGSAEIADAWEWLSNIHAAVGQNEEHE